MAEPIQVDFTLFNMLETVRAELEQRRKELAKVEADIAEILFELEKIRYLQSLDVFYQDQKNLSYPEKYQEFPDLEQKREDLLRVIAILEQQQQALESQAHATDVAPPQAPQQAAVEHKQKRRFDNFESFRRNKLGGS